MCRRLDSFSFYRDVINKFGRREGSGSRPDELDDTVFGGDVDEDRFIWSMDTWFRGAEGQSVQFTGNEGNGEETEYSCYVLVVGRRGPAGPEEWRESESEEGDASESDLTAGCRDEEWEVEADVLDKSESEAEGAGVSYHTVADPATKM